MTDNRPFESDDEDDTLLFEKLQEHVLQNYPNPQRIGCLDRATLQTLVENPEKLNLGDPKYLHVFKCAECTRELIELRKLRNEEIMPTSLTAAIATSTSKSSNWRWATLTAVFLLCSILFGGLLIWRSHSGTNGARNTNEVAVAETIDLSRAGTPRGNEASSVALGLPRRLVSLHIVLPYYSPGGHYRVSITAQRLDGSAKAEGDAIALAQGQHAEITVSLDLRNLIPGTYYLATTHDGDPASYFYPVTIR